MASKTSAKASSKRPRQKRKAAAKRLEIVYFPLAKLKPDPANPKLHDERSLDEVRRSIDSLGVYKPIIVQARTLRIIAGHARYAVFKEKGIDPAPCIVAAVNDGKAREMMLRDNRSAEFGEWDAEKLRDLLDELDEELKLAPLDLGFTDDEIEELLGDLDEPADDGAAPGDHKPEATVFKVMVQCKDKRDQEGLIDRLEKQGYTCHSMTS